MSIETVTEVEEHAHEGLDGLWEIMFGWEHVVAEIFWNSVWLLGAFALGRLVALRKIHKYIDDQHGITHDDSDKKEEKPQGMVE